MTDEQTATRPESFPDQAGTLSLPGPAGQLELAVDLAEPECARAGVVVLCHPHPQHGGTMRNKVVTMLERALRESGLDTVRFNFRGVGASQGEYDEGRGETVDLDAVASWVREVRPNDALWLAGFSFGSFVALRSAQVLEADALITVAPPVGRWEFGDIELPTCPWLLIQGEDDEVVDATAVFEWAESLEFKPNVVRMPETGHYFHRRLMDLRGAVKNGVRSWLPAPR
ncbi:MAG: alpha/beta fold hydrolase [Rhodanobacteraceae bacterium]